MRRCAEEIQNGCCDTVGAAEVVVAAYADGGDDG